MNRMTTTLFGLALIVLLCGAASATDIYVNQTGWWNATGDTTFHAIDPGQIQAAIDNATAGDTICVWNGTYNENVDIGTSHLTLKGEGATVVTVTAAAANDYVFCVTKDYVNITGFNVTGATNWCAGLLLYDADHCNILDNIASGNYDGIELCRDSSDNTLIGNNCSGNGDDGIGLSDSCDNNTLTGNNCSGNDNDGIALWSSSDNNTLTENDCSGNDIGICLWGSSDNTLTGNNCSDNTGWGFYSDDSHNNTVEDLTVASYPTTISFTYENGIAITGVEIPPADPAGKANITRYVNATNVSADSKLFLNVSYNESDLAGLDESSLLMWRHNGTAWYKVAGSGVNVTGNYVYANITAFSVFAPMGSYYPLNLSKTDDIGDCAKVGDTITYKLCYDNLQNPDTALHNVTINDTLPAGVNFASASDDWSYNPSTRTVTWTIGDLSAGAAEACVTLNVTVNTGTEGQTLRNCATIESDETEPRTACEDTDVCAGEPTPTPVPALAPIGMLALIGAVGLVLVLGSISIRRKED